MAVMTRDIERRVSRFMQRNNLSGKTMLLAVSGGPDSVCLLHLFAGLKTELGLTLHVAHLDHQLRGEESSADAEFVRALAKNLGLPATIGQADVKAYRQDRKLSLEEAAREVRYAFLAETAQRAGTELIVTGHTQNDQVETILMHIIRGSGTRGLVGLKPLTPRTIDNRNIIIVRPLLDITREETLDYCREQGLNPRVDSSNFELSPLRNKVRLELLPLLGEYNADVSRALLKLSSYAADELNYLDEQVAALWQKVAVRKEDVITLDRGGLKALHPALLRLLLRSCFEQLPGGLKDIESGHIEDILSLLDKPAGRRIDLPYGLVCMAGYNQIWLGKEDDLPCPFPPLDGEYALTIPGVTHLPGWQVEAGLVPAMDSQDNPLTAYMDMDLVGRNLAVRTWRNADRFQPLGLKADKKLGEFMIDASIPRLWRKKIPVVTSPTGIVWLVGYRLDERAKVTPPTGQILRLEFKPA